MRPIVLSAILLLGATTDVEADEPLADSPFDRVRILGSGTAQLNASSDSSALTGGVGVSGENEHLYVYVLMSLGRSSNPMSVPVSPHSLGAFILSPPISDRGLTLRARYLTSDDNYCYGAFAQIDVGAGDAAGVVDNVARTKAALGVAVDAGLTGRLMFSRRQGIALFGFAGLAMRKLGGDVAADAELLQATIASETSAYIGVSASAMLQLGDFFGGLQMTYLTGGVAGLSGWQMVPVVGLRGGFDLYARAATKHVSRESETLAAADGDEEAGEAEAQPDPESPEASTAIGGSGETEPTPMPVPDVEGDAIGPPPDDGGATETMPDPMPVAAEPAPREPEEHNPVL